MELIQKKSFSTHIFTLLSVVDKVKISETDFNDCLGRGGLGRGGEGLAYLL